MYFNKLCVLHPDFGAWYSNWVSEPKNVVKFSPDALNKQYNSFSEVVLS